MNISSLRSTFLAFGVLMSCSSVHAQNFMTYTSVHAQLSINSISTPPALSPFVLGFSARHEINEKHGFRAELKYMTNRAKQKTGNLYCFNDSVSNFLPSNISVMATTKINAVSIGFDYIFNFGRPAHSVSGFYFFTGLYYFAGQIQSKIDYQDAQGIEFYEANEAFNAWNYKPYKMRGMAINLGFGYEVIVGNGLLTFEYTTGFPLSMFVGNGSSSSTESPVFGPPLLVGIGAGYRFYVTPNVY